MEINGSATNIPYKAPSEVDGQDRTQSRLQSQDQQTSNRPPADTVDISSEAQALNVRERTNDAALIVPEPTRVEANQTAQNVDQNQPTSPTPPVTPEQVPLETTTEPSGTENTTQQQQATLAQTPDTPSQPTPPPEATIITQNVAPQNETTQQKPAQESPMAAAGGLSAGKGIDLNV